MSRRWFGQFPDDEALTIRAIGSDPARLVLVRRSLQGNAGLRFNAKTFDSDRYEREDRPAGIFLKSLWKATQLPSGIGYEDVTVGQFGEPGLIPRHLHEKSNAVWFVYEGEGRAAMEVGNSEFNIPVGPGSWGYFKAGQWHGLWGNMKFISVQIPDIETDYKFEDGRDYAYQKEEE